MIEQIIRELVNNHGGQKRYKVHSYLHDTVETELNKLVPYAHRHGMRISWKVKCAGGFFNKKVYFLVRVKPMHSVCNCGGDQQSQE